MIDNARVKAQSHNMMYLHRHCTGFNRCTADSPQRVSTIKNNKIASMETFCSILRPTHISMNMDPKGRRPPANIIVEGWRYHGRSGMGDGIRFILQKYNDFTEM